MTTARGPSPMPGIADGELKQARHHSSHTAESAWRAWDGWDAIPDVDLPAGGARILVVSTPPDDDVLAVDGLLLRPQLQDGRLRDARAELATRLAPHLDGHPDLGACGRAALAAAQRAAGALTVLPHPVLAHFTRAVEVVCSDDRRHLL